MSETIATDRITLLYFCPECGQHSEQLLTNLVQNGTHTCECGADMELQDRVLVRVKNEDTCEQ